MEISEENISPCCLYKKLLLEVAEMEFMYFHIVFHFPLFHTYFPHLPNYLTVT